MKFRNKHRNPIYTQICKQLFALIPLLCNHQTLSLYIDIKNINLAPTYLLFYFQNEK